MNKGDNKTFNQLSQPEKTDSKTFFDIFSEETKNEEILFPEKKEDTLSLNMLNNQSESIFDKDSVEEPSKEDNDESKEKIAENINDIFFSSNNDIFEKNEPSTESETLSNLFFEEKENTDSTQDAIITPDLKDSLTPDSIFFGNNDDKDEKGPMDKEISPEKQSNNNIFFNTSNKQTEKELEEDREKEKNDSLNNSIFFGNDSENNSQNSQPEQSENNNDDSEKKEITNQEVKEKTKNFLNICYIKTINCATPKLVIFCKIIWIITKIELI